MNIRRIRIAYAAPVLLVSALALSGCMKLEGDMNVNADATASGTFTVEIAQQAAGLLGLTSAEALAQEVNSGKFGGGSSASSISCSPIDRSGAFAVECAFDNVPFTDSTELWSIKKDGENVVVTVNGSQDSTTDMTSNPFASAIPSDSLDLTFRFPGDIVSIKGDKATQVDSRTVNVKASILDTFSATITAKAESSRSSVTPILIGAAVVIVLAVVIALVLILRRGRSGVSAPDIPPAQTITEGPADQV